MFQQPRGLQTANGAPPLDFHGISPLVDTFSQPLPIADDRQQPLPQLSERRTYVSGAVLPSKGGAEQLLIPVRLNGALVDCTLIDSGSSLSMVSASTLAALSVPPSVEPLMSGTPIIVDIGASLFHVQGYVVAAVAVSDVEVRHRLVVIRELAFPLLIGYDIFRPHRAIIELGPPDVVQLGVDRCPVCVDQRVPAIPQRDVAEAVVSNREPVDQPIGVLGDSTSFVKPLPNGLASMACAVLLAVCATTGGARVLSVDNASNKLVYKCAGSPIVDVLSVTPPQLSSLAIRKQASDSRRDARRPRRPRGRHRAPQRVDTPTSNSVRRRRSPSSSASNHRVWTPSAALVTPCSGCVT